MSTLKRLWLMSFGLSLIFLQGCFLPLRSVSDAEIPGEYKLDAVPTCGTMQIRPDGTFREEVRDRCIGRSLTVSGTWHVSRQDYVMKVVFSSFVIVTGSPDVLSGPYPTDKEIFKTPFGRIKIEMDPDVGQSWIKAK